MRTKNDRKSIVRLQPSIAEGFSELLDEGRLRYDGYCDDPRNTDDSWTHTFVHHSHVPDSVGRLLNISHKTRLWTPPGTMAMEFRWIEVDSGLPEYRTLYATHLEFVELCVPLCKCGRRIYDNDEGSHTVWNGKGGSAWSTKDMGGEDEGAVFGRLQFLGRSSPAQYVRAQLQSDDDALRVRAILDEFGLRVPDATIAVTGGAQDFAMDSQLARAVFQGIVRAAETSKACIVDGGTDTGVMKLLGDAVNRSGHSVDLIGVAGWGAVIGRHCMHRGSGGMESRAYYSKTKPTSATGAGLDPNHKFYVLVDDGTVGRFGTEIAARSRLEKILRDPKRFCEFKKFLELSLHMDQNIDALTMSTTQPEQIDLDDALTWTPGALIRFHKFLCASSAKEESNEVHFLDRLRSRGERPRRKPWKEICKDAMERRKSEFISLHEVFEIDQYLNELGAGAPTELACPTIRRERSQADGDLLEVNRCCECEGADRDHITRSRTTKSVDCETVNRWYNVKLTLDRDESRGRESRLVACANCSANHSVEDVRGERFVPCCSGKCRHYFFRRSLADARRNGRESVTCDGCLEGVSLDSLLGRFVPGVQVVVQGGFGTLKTVAMTNAVASDRAASDSTDSQDAMEQSRETCTPIVVVEGSGKAADFIALTWRHLHEPVSEGGKRCHQDSHARTRCVAHTRRYQNGSQKPQTLRMATCPVIEREYCRLFGRVSLQDIDRKRISWIIETCRRKESVALYTPTESSEGLDFAILWAMCRGTLREGRPLSTVEQLRLAIGWEHAEEGGSASTAVVREILAEDASAPSEAASVHRRRALLYALQRNSWRSARLLVHAGVSLPREDAVFRALYPRERGDELSAEAAVPSSLRSFLLSEEVRRWTVRAVFDDFRRGLLTDEDAPLRASASAEKADESETQGWEATLAWQRARRILGLSGSGRASDLFDWESIGAGPPRLRGDVTPRQFAKLVSEVAFRRELFGTRAHVTGAMRVLGWARPDQAAAEAAALTDEDANGDLFVWAILMGRTELAKFFWRRSPHAEHVHCISRALFAAAVARRLAARVDDQAAEQLVGGVPTASDDRDADAPLPRWDDGGSVAPLAVQFGELAKRLVRRCFDRDQRAAVEVIQLQWTGRDSWLDYLGPYPEPVSPLQLADMARAEDFVVDPAFQSCVDDLWYGQTTASYAVAAAAAKTAAAVAAGASTEDVSEKLVLPFSPRSWLLKPFLGLSAGAGTIPAIVLTAFYANFEKCIIAVSTSYLVLRF
jgi:hypothetical protein